MNELCFVCKNNIGSAGAVTLAKALKDNTFNDAFHSYFSEKV